MQTVQTVSVQTDQNPTDFVPVAIPVNAGKEEQDLIRIFHNTTGDAPCQTNGNNGATSTADDEKERAIKVFTSAYKLSGSVVAWTTIVGLIALGVRALAETNNAAAFFMLFPVCVMASPVIGTITGICSGMIIGKCMANRKTNYDLSLKEIFRASGPPIIKIINVVATPFCLLLI